MTYRFINPWRFTVTAILVLAAALGAWFAVRSVLDVLPSLPRNNSDFIFL